MTPIQGTFEEFIKNPSQPVSKEQCAMAAAMQNGIANFVDKGLKPTVIPADDPINGLNGFVVFAIDKLGKEVASHFVTPACFPSKHSEHRCNTVTKSVRRKLMTLVVG